MGHEHHHHALTVSGDPLTIATFIATLAFSFFASFHCAGMCAPLVHATLGRDATPRRAAIWVYNAGRMVAYTGLGAILGALQASLNAFAQDAGKALAFGISVFLMALAVLHLFNRLSFKQNFLPKKLQNIVMRVSRRVMTLTPVKRAFFLGTITAFLPCMTLTPAFAGAAATGSAFQGSLWMLAFFLGTVPAMLIAPGMPHALTRFVPPRLAQPLSALFLFLAGLITFLRISH